MKCPGVPPPSTTHDAIPVLLGVTTRNFQPEDAAPARGHNAEEAIQVTLNGTGKQFEIVPLRSEGKR